MAIVRVNSGAKFNDTGGATTSFTLGWTPVSGNMLIAWCYHVGTTALTVADDRGTGNTYTIDVDVTKTSQLRGIFVHCNYTGSGTPTITVTNNASVVCSIIVAEYSGVDSGGTPTDGTNSGTGTASNPAAGNITTTNANDLLLAGFGDLTGANDTITAGSGYSFVQQNGDGTTIFVGAMEEQIVSATGTYTNGFTYNPTQQWVAAHVAYKQATAAPTNTAQLLAKVAIV